MLAPGSATLTAMDIQVVALHPSPVVTLPPRARKPRLAFAETRTPVRLRRLDADAAEPAFGLRLGRDPTFERLRGETGLWSPLRRATHVSPTLDLRLRDFLAFLSGDPAFERSDEWPGLVEAFSRTPLVGVREKGSPGRDAPIPHRGAPTGEAPVDAGRILLDSRDRTPGELAAFLDASIRIVDGSVYRRVEPLLTATQDTRYRFEQRWNVALMESASDGGDLRSGPPPLPVLGTEKALGLWHAFESGCAEVSWDPEAEALARAGLPETGGIADAVDLANRLPAYAQARLARLDPSFRDAAVSLDAGFRERLSLLALRGATGAIPEPEAGEVLGWLGPALASYAEIADHPDANDLHGIGSYVAHAIQPRLERPAEIDPSDGEALSALVP